MPLFELAIAVCDEEDLPSGHKRKKEGDIIAVKPYPWQWGKKEVDEYLIVPISAADIEEVSILNTPLYEDGCVSTEFDDEEHIQNWSTETDYDIGEEVKINNDRIFVCQKPGTSGLEQPNTSFQVDKLMLQDFRSV